MYTFYKSLQKNLDRILFRLKMISSMDCIEWLKNGLNAMSFQSQVVLQLGALKKLHTFNDKRQIFKGFIMWPQILFYHSVWSITQIANSSTLCVKGFIMDVTLACVREDKFWFRIDHWKIKSF